MTHDHHDTLPTASAQERGPKPATAISRRALAAGGIGAMLLSLRPANAQQSPPIEPREGTTPIDDDEVIIEPEPTVELEPDTDAGTITDVAASSEVQYFAETGHNLDQPFLAAWMLAGGSAGPGAPISEQRVVEGTGTIRQDFRGLALFYDPAAGNDGQIWSAPLPDESVRMLAPSTARAVVSGCTVGRGGGQFFGETGHTVSEPIASFWNEHGQVQLIGLPLSEPFSSNGRTAQVFESAVLDYGTDRTVTFRPVNTDIAAYEFSGDEAFLPVPPTLGTTTLVTAGQGLRLRSGPSEDAEGIAVLPQNAEFIAAPGDHTTWVPGYVDGFSGWVAAEFLASSATTANVDRPTAEWRLDVWQGLTVGESNVRSEPTTASATIRTLAAGEDLAVVQWVRGEAVVENQITWALLEDGGYVYARNIVRHAPVEPPPLPADAPTEGRWIDVHLTQQLMVAYEGRSAVRTVVTTTGMPGWETPPGWYAINWRVANETMESGSIGAESFYVLKDVLFTQYFTNRGHALHYAWWKTAETIGRPGSHGCLNLLMDDAQFFWDWAGVGTPVICRTV